MEVDQIMMKKIRNMFPLTDGLFDKMNYQFPSVFSITNAEMDFLFVTNYGMRSIAPVVAVAYEDSESGYVDTLASLILHMYKPKWDRLASLVTIEYDPIHNFSDDYHEEINEGITGGETVTYNTTDTNQNTTDNDTVVTDGGSERRTHSDQNSKTRTDNLSEAVAREGENNIFGFNSVDAVGADTDASNTTRTNTGTQATAGTDSGESTVYGGLTHTTDGTVTENGSKRKTGTEGTERSSDRERVREFTRIGNIGNITTQQLVNEEIKLWRWNFIQEVLNDVKDFLTIPVYD